MKHPLAALLVCVALWLAACDSGEGTAGEGTGAAADTTEAPAPVTQESDQPEPRTFFVGADSAAINAAASKAQRTGAKAQSTKGRNACDRAGDRGYRAWRTCWHSLLDPFAAALTRQASEFGILAQGEFPAECVAALTKAQDTFSGFASDVDRLVTGIDSDRRKAQVRALRVYEATMQAIATGFAAPFRAITGVCYSPADLASINASPSPSPSSGQSP